MGVGCAGRFGVGGLGLGSGGLCFPVWGWWVGVGWSEFAVESLVSGGLCVRVCSILANAVSKHP